MNSLDPRVNRLPQVGQPEHVEPKAPLDQFGTFEVFVQPKEGKPFQHEGIVHAPNLEMAFVLAKEAFTRRFQCVSLYVVDTRNVYVSAMTEGNQSVFELIHDTPEQPGEKESYEIFFLTKRGKQHIHIGSVTAATPGEALTLTAKDYKTDKIIYNVWAIRTNDIRFTKPEEQELWLTLPEKKFRDASAYKAGDKLKDFLEKVNN
ncbi:MAG: phenylacetic acid degradation b [Cyclobacteriaceae bacterium]|nr:phenylacetic acid degradation b [Cyclobacteriaceae bacterium]